MLHEVQQYMRVKERADQELNDWHAHSRTDQPRRPHTPAWDATPQERAAFERDYEEYQRSYREWDRKFHDEYREAHDKHRDTMREARHKLRRKTEDPMLIWMMDNIEDYWSYIETVMPILPATREQLENLADEHDWCSEFDGFMERATEAGIVPPVQDPYNTSELVEWVVNRDYDDNDRTARRQIQARVNQIVEKALAVAHNEKATADVQPA